ncbi:MAG: IMP dehydrogenase [Schleiferiaceae bacterium]|nr:IMP dehydrogenase [Schleiferiaceae bacterium]MDR9441814.1 IMP dehydrogenase [Schleiferiaceae bacterium]
MSQNSAKIMGEALTYDDVLLQPAFSKVLPREVQITTRFTRNIPLRAPIASAAMDTVTESAMAIAIAQDGGIGVLHKNMTIEQQAVEVRNVKRAESGMILDPVTLPESALVKDALEIMREFRIGGIPIVNEQKKLIGIITNRDLRFEKDTERPLKEIMTTEGLITTHENTSLEEAEVILQKHKIEKLPVVKQDRTLIGLITYRDITKLHIKPNACKDDFGRLRVAAAVGVTADILDRVSALVNSYVDAIVIDTAHGHTQGVVEALKRVKAQFPDLDCVVGNVGTAEGARFLADAGADAVKVGIGPGSICTTRVVAGVGTPQLTAVMEAAKGLEGTGVPLIADGGIRHTGDIPKALAAGADSVMLGSLLAGTKESPGELVIYEGRRYKTYRGMGSIEAMQQGSKDRYFQDVEDDIRKLVPEGIVGRVAYKGETSEVMYQFIGGLRAGMGYCGAPDIATLKANGRFFKVTAAGVNESHPHDVSVTSESPNYSRK